MTRSERTIMQVSPFSSPYSGNFIASLNALQETVEAQGWRLVHVLPESAQNWPWFDSLRASARVRLVKGHRRRLKTALRLARIAREENAAIVHTHFTDFDLSASLARLLLKLMGREVGLVWHYHSPRAPRASAIERLKDFAKLRVFGAGAYVLAVNEEIKDDLVSRGFDARRAGYLFNGIDLGRPVAAPGARDGARASLGIGPRTTAVLLFGWDPYRKGVDVALEAVRQLASAGSDVALVVVGEERTRSFILERCDGTVPSFVTLLPPRESVADLYAAADAFLSIGRVEGMTYSVGEAMAASLPVVATDIPGQEWMRGSEGVVSVPAGDSSALAEALETLIGLSAADNERLGRANRAASKMVSIQRWSERLLDFYGRVLGRADAMGGDTRWARACP